MRIKKRLSESRLFAFCACKKHLSESRLFAFYAFFVRVRNIQMKVACLLFMLFFVRVKLSC